jgi:hypothetical protein
MRRLFVGAALFVAALSLTAGCENKAGVEKTKTVTTPGGETTTTESKEITTSGEHPPSANP